MICHDTSQFAANKAKKKLEVALNRSFYYVGRECLYENVPWKIIAEQYMEETYGTELKIHCFDGIPRFVLVCSERFSDEGLREDFYDIDWNLMDLRRPKNLNSVNGVQKTEIFKEMLDCARVLTKGLPFARIDFYVINNKIFFRGNYLFPHIWVYTIYSGEMGRYFWRMV